MIVSLLTIPVLSPKDPFSFEPPKLRFFPIPKNANEGLLEKRGKKERSVSRRTERKK
jgi:hypothetical protein